jgi:hypothetical protein
MKKVSCIFIFGVILGLASAFLIVDIAFAFELVNPFKFETIEELIGAITGFIFQLALVIAPVMFVIAGFFFMTSGGEPEKVRKAKSLFFYTLIGLIIVLTASGLYSVIISVLGGSEEPEEESFQGFNRLYTYNDDELYLQKSEEVGVMSEEFLKGRF